MSCGFLFIGDIGYNEFLFSWGKTPLRSRFEAFTAVEIQVDVFWVVTTCSAAVGYQHFGKPRCFHLQGDLNCVTSSTRTSRHVHVKPTEILSSYRRRSQIYIHAFRKTLHNSYSYVDLCESNFQPHACMT
jgi:hypothetical protein